MTAYFGFEPSESLKNDIQTLLANLAKKAPEPQYHLSSEISKVFTDEVIDNLLLNLVGVMQNHSDGSEGGGLLKFLGGFLKTVMHGALKVMLGKCDNAEVNKRADFLRMRLLQLPNDKTRLGFQLPQDVYNHFQYCFSEVDAGNGKQITEELIKTMLTFTDLSLVHFFDDFIGGLNLGMINRKMASVTRSGIHKESHSTIKKLIPSLTDAQLKDFSIYFKSMLVER
ncbi:MAG: hypothetical protein RJA86_1536 [Pseudomonadota bacterium]|jgi:hypothetical protein|nr:hypothetical protein [Agitococcus sp.]